MVMPNTNRETEMGAASRICYTDRREVMIDSLNKMVEEIRAGSIQSVGIVALMSDGSFKCEEAYRDNSDRLSLIGGTQVLAQHIMAGDE
jgi:hypothetical protein